MSKSDIHDILLDYAAAFVQQKNASDWNNLATHEQEIAALWLLEADVYNGGFVQFFCNWGEEAERLDKLDKRFWGDRDHIAEIAYRYYVQELGITVSS